MSACVRVCVWVPLRVGTDAQKKGVRGEEVKKEVRSHRFSGNLIKPSGDEGKAIQDVARACKKLPLKLVLPTRFHNDFLAFVRCVDAHMCVCARVYVDLRESHSNQLEYRVICSYLYAKTALSNYAEWLLRMFSIYIS